MGSPSLPPPIQKPPPLKPGDRKDHNAADNSVLISILVVALVLFLVFLSAIPLKMAGNGGRPEAEGDQEAAKLGESNTEGRADLSDVKAGQSQNADGGNQPTTAQDEEEPNKHAEIDKDNRDDSKLPSANEEAEKVQESGPSIAAFQRHDGSGEVVVSIGLPGESNPFIVAGGVGSVIFVVDKSGSMDHDRLGRVIAALNEAIEALQPNQRFMVLFFNDSVLQLKGMSGLVTASGANVTKYKRWIASNKTGSGGTQPLGAMELAISLRPERIIILSDGDFSPIDVAKITQRNSEQSKRIQIDAIGLTENVRTLSKLANENDGIYYQAR